MQVIFNHVSHSYDADTQLKTDALNDISFKIGDNEFIGLIGHTGSGKSTLVQHMNGLIKPTSGEVYFDGKDISDNLIYRVIAFLSERVVNRGQYAL